MCDARIQSTQHRHRRRLAVPSKLLSPGTCPPPRPRTTYAVTCVLAGKREERAAHALRDSSRSLESYLCSRSRNIQILLALEEGDQVRVKPSKGTLSQARHLCARKNADRRCCPCITHRCAPRLHGCLRGGPAAPPCTAATAARRRRALIDAYEEAHCGRGCDGAS